MQIHFGCYSLTNIEVDPANEYFCSENGVVYSFDKTTLVVFAGDKSEFNIPEGVTTIAKFAFSRSRISKLSIPNSMTTICEYAFSRFKDLNSIVLPNSVERIYWGAFNNCSSLTSITIGRSMAYFDRSVFTGCSNLTKIINLNPTPPRCLFNALADIGKKASVTLSNYGNTRASDTFSYNETDGMPVLTKPYSSVVGADRLRGWIYTIHTGGLGGICTRILWMLAALLGASLPLTGYYIWIFRLVKKRQAKLAAAQKH